MPIQFGKEITQITLGDKSKESIAVEKTLFLLNEGLVKSIRGEVGDKGDKGDTGAKGEPGKAGIAGINSKDGERGDTGEKGKNGKDGIRGIDGRPGEEGKKGLEGEKGKIPKHEIAYGRIRFEQEEGWGQWIEMGSKDGMGSKVLHRGGKVLENITITEDYSATVRDEVILADVSGGTLTITLPLANDSPKFEYHIKKIDSTSHVVTVQGRNSETIDDETSIVINTSERSLRLYSNGVNWYII